MAKFDVYRRADGGGYVLDCQADLLGDLNTRFVVPLLPEEQAPGCAARLNPAFEVEGRTLVMLTQFAAAILVRDLGRPVLSLLSEQDAINNALDMLISGI
jgi:toxin CcdB